MEIKALGDQSCQVGEQFCNVFYDRLDKQRHIISNLYTPLSVLIWNGNAYSGENAIKEFYINLPSTTHVIQSLDCQPLNPSTVNEADQLTVLVVVEGTVKMPEKRSQYFSQTFILASHNNSWKVMSDCFRLIDK